MGAGIFNVLVSRRPSCLCVEVQASICACIFLSEYLSDVATFDDDLDVVTDSSSEGVLSPTCERRPVPGVLPPSSSTGVGVRCWSFVSASLGEVRSSD